MYGADLFIYYLAYLSGCITALAKLPPPTFGKTHLCGWKSSQNPTIQPYTTSCKRNRFESHSSKQNRHGFSSQGTRSLVGEIRSKTYKHPGKSMITNCRFYERKTDDTIREKSQGY